MVIISWRLRISMKNAEISKKRGKIKGEEAKQKNDRIEYGDWRVVRATQASKGSRSVLNGEITILYTHTHRERELRPFFSRSQPTDPAQYYSIDQLLGKGGGWVCKLSGQPHILPSF